MNHFIGVAGRRGVHAMEMHVHRGRVHDRCAAAGGRVHRHRHAPGLAAWRWPQRGSSGVMLSVSPGRTCSVGNSAAVGGDEAEQLAARLVRRGHIVQFDVQRAASAEQRRAARRPDCPPAAAGRRRASPPPGRASRCGARRWPPGRGLPSTAASVRKTGMAGRYTSLLRALLATGGPDSRDAGPRSSEH